MFIDNKGSEKKVLIHSYSNVEEKN